MDYSQYLQSSVWRERARDALRRADYRCQVCYSPNDLEVHHRTYKRIGNEEPGDLTVLCAECHERNHKYMEPTPFDWLRRIGINVYAPIPY